MTLTFCDKVGILKFKALDNINYINHSVSTRYGGVSSQNGLDTLNMGTFTSDNFDNVKTNYKLFCNAAGYNEKRVVLGYQTHSLNVRHVTETDCGKGVFKDRDYTDVDALITDCKNIPLVIHTADCVPVSLIDTQNKAIGCAHCGWRGTIGRLAEITLNAMQKKFATKPENIISLIGPCICQNCYEVSKDLFTSFEQEFGSSSNLMQSGDSYYIDLAGMNKSLLIEHGVKESNIYVSDICTCCNTDLLYSHRGQGPERGIFSTFLEIV